MTNQEKTGWGIIAIVLLIFWWLDNNARNFLHGTSVQTTMKTPDGTVIQQNQPTLDYGCSATLNAPCGPTTPGVAVG